MGISTEEDPSPQLNVGGWRRGDHCFGGGGGGVNWKAGVERRDVTMQAAGGNIYRYSSTMISSVDQPGELKPRTGEPSNTL